MLQSFLLKKIIIEFIFGTWVKMKPQIFWIKMDKKIIALGDTEIEKQISLPLSIVLIDSLFKIGKNYYPQVSLEECKYVVKEKKDKQLH